MDENKYSEEKIALAVAPVILQNELNKVNRANNNSKRQKQKPNYVSISKQAFAFAKTFVAQRENAHIVIDNIMQAAENNIDYEVIITWGPAAINNPEHSSYKYYTINSVNKTEQTINITPVDNFESNVPYSGEKLPFNVHISEIKFIAESILEEDEE